MKEIVIQGTGCVPMRFSGQLIAQRAMNVDAKRSVSVSIYLANPDPEDIGEQQYYAAEVKYITSWDTELGYSWVWAADDLDDVADRIGAHCECDSFLPPGAGYPGTVEFEGRQSKLQGMLQAYVLHCLTDCLRDADDDLQAKGEEE